MVTITFNCPSCKCLCAFKDIYAGRRARCLRCNQVFIIPDKDGAEARKIEQPKEFDEPLPGFFKAVFKYSWRAIFNKQSLATLLFILVVTALKFFTVHFDFSVRVGFFTIHLPVGSAIAVFVWGGIFWCYAEIIYATAFDVEPLPQITFGGWYGYLFSVLKSFYSFAIALLIVLLPAIIFRYIFSITGIQSRWALFPFIILGMFLFPMAVLTVSISRDMAMLLRLDYFFKPVKKAFWHYLFVAGLFILTGQLQYASRNFGDIVGGSAFVILLNLAAVLAIQILAVFTMRATGLFYRHFVCYFKW